MKFVIPCIPCHVIRPPLAKWQLTQCVVQDSYSNPHQMLTKQEFIFCHSKFPKIYILHCTCTNSKASTSSSLCASHAGCGGTIRCGALLSRISKCVSFTKGNVGLYKHLKQQANLLQHVEYLPVELYPKDFKGCNHSICKSHKMSHVNVRAKNSIKLL